MLLTIVKNSCTDRLLQLPLKSIQLGVADRDSRENPYRISRYSVSFFSCVKISSIFTRTHKGLYMKRILLFFTVLIGGVIQSIAQSDLHQKIEDAWSMRYESPDSVYQLLSNYTETAIQEKSKKEEARLYSYRGVLEDLKGNSDKAIELLLQAIRIQEGAYPEDLSFSYNNLGIAYFYQYNYKKALEYYNLSLEEDRKRKDPEGVAGTLINIGVVYTYIDSFPQALSMYSEAREVYESLNDSSGIASVLNNVGKLEFAEKEYAKAIRTYERSLTYSRNLSNPEIKFTTHYSLANCYFESGKIDLAILHTKKAIELAEKSGARERLQYGFEMLADLYAGKGEYKQAYIHQKKYTDLRDSLVNEDKNLRIAQMQELYESEKKDKVIAQQELEKQELEKIRQQKDRDLEEKTRQRNLFVGITLAAFFLLSVLYFAYRVKKRNEVLLEERNVAIQENLHQKEMMIGEVHHRVKNNLQLISSILDLQARNLSDEKALKAIEDSRHRVQSMSLIHQKLYTKENINGIRMDEYLKQLCEGILQSMKKEQTIVLRTEIEPVALHIDTSIPIGLIVTEVVTNAMKYAFQDRDSGTITIRFRKKEEVLELILTDDGVGMDRTSPDSTSTSFGMKMINSLCRQLKAELTIETNGGTAFRFNIKKYRIIE